jgi:hypothetical protein
MAHVDNGGLIAYAKFDNYKLTDLGKLTLKWSMLLVVPTSFIGLNIMAGGNSGNTFQDLSMSTFQIPQKYLIIGHYVCALSAIAFFESLFSNYRESKKFPSVNFLVPYVTFYLWWYPGFWPL